jgi:hypothetical protein
MGSCCSSDGNVKSAYAAQLHAIRHRNGKTSSVPQLTPPSKHKAHKSKELDAMLMHVQRSAQKRASLSHSNASAVRRRNSIATATAIARAAAVQLKKQLQRQREEQRRREETNATRFELSGSPGSFYESFVETTTHTTTSGSGSGTGSAAYSGESSSGSSNVVARAFQLHGGANIRSTSSSVRLPNLSELCECGWCVCVCLQQQQQAAGSSKQQQTTNHLHRAFLFVLYLYARNVFFLFPAFLLRLYCQYLPRTCLTNDVI